MTNSANMTILSNEKKQRYIIVGQKIMIRVHHRTMCDLMLTTRKSRGQYFLKLQDNI